MSNNDEKQKTTIPDFFKSRGWFFLGVIAVALGLTGIFALKRHETEADRATRPLVVAFRNRRFVEPRISGGFSAGRFDANRDDPAGVDNNQLESARASILDSVAAGHPASHLAYARLLLCENEKLSTAAKHLRIVINSGKDAPEAHNDLGACLFQQGRVEDALDEFNLALNTKPRMKEALFNRALCYEELQLRGPALTAFAGLEKTEEDPSWLNETRQRRAKLSEGTPASPYDREVAALDDAFAAGKLDDVKTAVKNRLELVTHHALADLVKSYLEAAAANDVAKAESIVRELSFVGGEISATHGDTEVDDAVRYLKSLPQAELSKELALVSECVATARKPGDNRAVFNRLTDVFRSRSNTVFQSLSGWFLGRQLYTTNNYLESASTLKSLIAFVSEHKWQTRRMVLMGQLGLALSRLGQDSQAIVYFDQSLLLARQLNTLVAKYLQNLSLPYWHIGALDKALKYLRDSIDQSMLEGPELNELAYDYLQIADLYRLRARHDLAILNAAESLRFADLAKHHRYAAQASSFMAVEHAQLGDSESAKNDLARSFQALEALEESSANTYNRPLVLTRAANVALRANDPQRALQYYDDAEKLLSSAQEKSLPMVRVLRGRAEALISVGQTQLAKENLERAVQILESYRATIVSSTDRSYFLETSQDVFNSLIALIMNGTGNEHEAFELTERGRARALLDDISSNAAKSTVKTAAEAASAPSPPGKRVVLPTLLQQLPEDLTLAVYSVTDRGTSIFLVKRSHFEVKTSRATSSELEDLTNRYLSNLQNPDTVDDTDAQAELSSQAKQLYDLLIAPIREQIRDDSTLCIVPDKSLHFLSFGGLQDAAGSYLVERYRLTYAPSASVLLQCIDDSARRARSGPEKIFAVGNPRFDRAYFPDLKDLKESESEALEAASFYPVKSSLIGAAATKSRVLNELRQCNVAHLASHCLINSSTPWGAALVLATPSSDRAAVPAEQKDITDAEHADELLSMSEISQVPMPRTRLVVLSACQTGLGRYFKGEGVVSLVRPFISSGVPSVVASLWSVDSQATRDLMVAFHKQRTSNSGKTAAALQAAQRQMLTGHYKHPYYWAAFVVVGI
jgi:CHAT domain-containing protein